MIVHTKSKKGRLSAATPKQPLTGWICESTSLIVNSNPFHRNRQHGFLKVVR